MIQVQNLVGDLYRGYLGSPLRSQVFANKSLLKKKLGTWLWSHCAYFIVTLRLTCNMTYLGQIVTSRSLDPCDRNTMKPEISR